MSHSIILTRNKFFLNNYTYSSHIQFQLKEDNKLLYSEENQKLIAEVKFSNNYKTKSIYDYNTGYFDAVYRYSPRKFELKNSNDDLIDGIYEQNLNAEQPTYSNENYVLKLLQKQDYYQWILFNKNNDTNILFQSNKIFKENYIESSSSENESNSNQQEPSDSQMYSDSQELITENQNEISYSILIPPRSLHSSSSSILYKPTIVWIENEQSSSNETESVSMKLLKINLYDANNNIISSIEYSNNFPTVQIEFVNDEYESLNSLSYSNYNSYIPDLSNDKIAYKNKSLQLSNIPYEKYHYAVEITPLSSSSSIENDNSIQKIISTSSDSELVFENFNNITYGNDNDIINDMITYDKKFINHLFKNYIIQMTITKFQQGDIECQYRLFEGVKYGKKHLTFKQLSALYDSIKGIGKWEELNLGFNDIDYSIDYNENGWWDIFKSTGKVQEKLNYNFVSISDNYAINENGQLFYFDNNIPTLIGTSKNWQVISDYYAINNGKLYYFNNNVPTQIGGASNWIFVSNNYVINEYTENGDIYHDLYKIDNTDNSITSIKEKIDFTFIAGNYGLSENGDLYYINEEIASIVSKVNTNENKFIKISENYAINNENKLYYLNCSQDHINDGISLISESAWKSISNHYAINSLGQLYYLNTDNINDIAIIKIGQNTNWKTILNNYAINSINELYYISESINPSSSELESESEIITSKINFPNNWSILSDEYAIDSNGKLYYLNVKDYPIQIDNGNWIQLSNNYAIKEIDQNTHELYYLHEDTITHERIATQVGSDIDWTSVTDNYALNSLGKLYYLNEDTATQVESDTNWIQLSNNYAIKEIDQNTHELYYLHEDTITHEMTATQIGSDIDWVSVSDKYALNEDNQLYYLNENTAIQTGENINWVSINKNFAYSSTEQYLLEESKITKLNEHYDAVSNNYSIKNNELFYINKHSSGDNVGRIIDSYGIYDFGQNDVIQIKVNDNYYNQDLDRVSGFREGIQLYNIFYGNDWEINFNNVYPYINKNTTSNVTQYMKGRLLQVISEESPGQTVMFSYHDIDLFNFNFNSNLIESIKSIEFVINDNNCMMPHVEGNKSFDFNQISSNKEYYTEAIIDGQDILYYLSPDNNNLLPCLNDNYIISAASYNEYGDLSIPYIKEHEIIYFKNALSIDFYNKANVYVKNSNQSAKFTFDISYKENIQNQNIVKEMIKNHKIPFEKIEISEESFQNLSENDTESFLHYPYTFDIQKDYVTDTQTETEVPIITYSDNQYHLTVPYGSKPKIQREKVVIPSDVNYQTSYYVSDGQIVSLGGEYRMMNYEETINEGFYQKINPSSSYYLTEYEYENDIKKHIYKKYISNNASENVNTYLFYIRYIENRWRIVGYNNRQLHINLNDDYTTYLMTQAEGNIGVEELKNYYYRRGDHLETYGQYRNSNSNITVIAEEKEHGYDKYLYVKLTDYYGNTTYVTSCKINIYQNIPKNLSLKLIGSDGNSNYTGFYKKYNRFFPSEFININFSAQSGIGLYYKLSGNVVNIGNEWKKMDESNSGKLLIKVKPVDYKNNLLNADQTIQVVLHIKDEAGNENEISSSIKYISRLYRTKNQRLLEQNNSYSHALFNENSNRIVEKRTSLTEYTRSWDEIWYPSTHGVPLNDDGSINQVQALRISKNVDTNGINGPTPLELLEYDKLTLDGSVLKTDSQGRYIQNMEGWDLTKTYPGMENSKISNNRYDKYWIIDNTGNVDFQLEFQVFDFSGTITTLPANLVAPDDGDMLAIYDASNNEAVREYVDIYGKTRYELINSSKLSLLCILKGSYRDSSNNPFALINSKLNGSLTNIDCGFILPPITSCQRICIIPFTDYGDEGNTTASGFKLKAGPRHYIEYKNYDVVNETGQFWIHQSPEVASGIWTSCTRLELNYKYYMTYATLNYEKGTVSFNERMNYPLLGTFTNYLYLSKYGNSKPYGYFSPAKNIYNFITSEDDLVDYSEPSFYIEPENSIITSSNYYDFSLNNNTQAGKLPSGYTFVKDTGIFTFTNKLPVGRLLSNYYYHTFYRLTSDGYGDLYFYGTGVLVPAPESASTKDWTYVDVKIVNEGMNSLNQGVLQFLTRGYVTKGTIVDTVLDQNRPWDVQQGTTIETVQSVGAYYSTSKSGLDNSYPATRAKAYDAKGKQTCNFGTLNAKGYTFLRIFWCISTNSEGTAWINCTRGAKCFSAELSGVYYIFTT